MALPEPSLGPLGRAQKSQKRACEPYVDVPEAPGRATIDVLGRLRVDVLDRHEVSPGQGSSCDDFLTRFSVHAGTLHFSPDS